VRAHSAVLVSAFNPAGYWMPAAKQQKVRTILELSKVINGHHHVAIRIIEIQLCCCHFRCLLSPLP
jgi:hypothetical protein